MIDIKLNDGQDGYDVVAEYIERYWKHNPKGVVVFRIGTSYDGDNYYLSNEIAEPTQFGYIEFSNDWWEGEKYIKLLGIQSLDVLDISGGIYIEDK